MRFGWFALVVLGGCGSSAPPGMPGPLVGMYDVMITSGGKSDSDVMNVSQASNDGVILNFVYGISEIRCALSGASAVTIPKQMLHVSHSTGVADGIGTGQGTIGTDGTVNLELDLYTAGIGGDGGQSGSTIVYDITGNKH